MNNEANATAAANAANVDTIPGVAGLEYRATYVHHGAAAIGYGATEAAARAHLADVLDFNLAHNGRLA
jgi:hypothetical protein